MISLPVLTSIVTWTGALFVVLAAVAVAIIAIRLSQPRLALFGLLPVALGILALVFVVGFPAPPVLPGLVALGLTALGVIGGNPLTEWVLTRAARGDADGIPAPAAATDDAPPVVPAPRQVLRGGTWIGYLERTAIIGAIAVGRFEIVAAVIAIKGLGRFSELDVPEARERFIIGTLVSFLWAGMCGALIALPGLLPVFF